MITEINKYEVLKELGSGQFGTVYMVLDRALTVQKAIKVIPTPNPTAIMKTLDEARILHKCKHNNIVHVNEANVFPVSGNPAVVIDMELVNGGSIESIINTRFVSVHETVRILTGTLFGLEHAHLNAVIHRDIKPANILYDGVNPKLSDFGLATNLAPGRTGSPQGYVQHLAPEVFSSGITDIRTDIYAAGVTLYRIVNNIRDWQGVISKIPDPIVAIQSGKLLGALGYQFYVPKKIRSIIAKSTNVDAIKRPQTAVELRQLLDKLKPRIDWRPNGSAGWSGVESLTKNLISLSMDKLRLVYQKNGRVVNAECANYSSIIEVQEAFEERIRDTTFI